MYLEKEEGGSYKSCTLRKQEKGRIVYSERGTGACILFLHKVYVPSRKNRNCAFLPIAGSCLLHDKGFTICLIAHRRGLYIFVLCCISCLVINWGSGFDTGSKEKVVLFMKRAHLVMFVLPPGETPPPRLGNIQLKKVSKSLYGNTVYVRPFATMP